MSWLCEVCGYENEYSEEVKVTVCNCCGEEASESILKQAQKELDDVRREEEQRIHLEEIAKKRELKESIISNIVQGLKKVGKAIPVAMLATILFSVAWVAVFYVSDDNGWSFVGDTSGDLDYVEDNISYIGWSIEDFTRNVGSNRPIGENVDDVAQSVVENIPIAGREVINTGSNIETNFPIYAEYLTRNVREVYEIIARKGD